MLGLVSRSRPRRPARPSLRVEALEGRDCPAAPTLDMSVRQLVGTTYEVYGRVIDESPGTAQLNLTGAVTGTVTPDHQGNFSYITTPNSLGTVTGKVTDAEYLNSAPVTGTITSLAPSLYFNILYGPGRLVTLFGEVADDAPAGLRVNFSAAATGFTTTGANGQFSLTVEATALGIVQATVADAWGQTTAFEETITNTDPVFATFNITHDISNIYVFEGYVTDECPVGLKVYLYSNTVPAVNGEEITVNQNGYFLLSKAIPAGQVGQVTASVTDAWDADGMKLAELLPA